MLRRTVSPPLPQSAERASWIELSASALHDNVQVFRELTRDLPHRPKLGAVLKGNAYGHGFAQMLPLVHPAVDVLYVITPEDALAIRAYESAQQRPTRQVLVLGAVGSEEARALAEARVEVVLADESWREIIGDLRRKPPSEKLRVQLHVDTGLGREGFTLAMLPDALRWIREGEDVLEVAGMLSHFANTEDVTEQSYAQHQRALFETACIQLDKEFPSPRATHIERHMAASAASLVLAPARYDALRVGIALYGIWPSAETRVSTRLVLPKLPMLRPVLRWKCASQAVKWLTAGSYVGYGCTYRTVQATRVAVLPVGYFDGYPRLASGKAHVVVEGHRCAVLGRVMMNHLVVDVTRVPEAPGNFARVEATLLGSDGDESVSAEALADWAQTIPYELLARLGPHLLRRGVT